MVSPSPDLICVAKGVLDEAKKEKERKGPILTPDEKLTLQNEADIKGTGFQMSIVSSEKGRVMLEAQRDSRRQRHIKALNEL